MSLAPAPPEPNGLHRFVRQQNAGNITQTTTHHHNGGAVLNTNLHAIDNSNSHDNSAAEKDMSQEDPDPDARNQTFLARHKGRLSRQFHDISSLGIQKQTLL